MLFRLQLTTEESRGVSTQNMNATSERCHDDPPKEEKNRVSSSSNLYQPIVLNTGYQFGINTLTSPPFLGRLQICSFHITLKNNGPVESMTVKYGSIQECAYRRKWSRTRSRNGWCGAEPIESFDIPVGSVLLNHNENVRKGSSRRWHRYTHIEHNPDVMRDYQIQIKINPSVMI